MSLQNEVLQVMLGIITTIVRMRYSIVAIIIACLQPRLGGEHLTSAQEL